MRIIGGNGAGNQIKNVMLRKLRADDRALLRNYPKRAEQKPEGITVSSRYLRKCHIYEIILKKYKRMTAERFKTQKYGERRIQIRFIQKLEVFRENVKQREERERCFGASEWTRTTDPHHVKVVL
jgi:hypothetical protein